MRSDDFTFSRWGHLFQVIDECPHYDFYYGFVLIQDVETGRRECCHIVAVPRGSAARTLAEVVGKPWEPA